MVRPRRLVAKRHRGLGPQKQRAIAAQPPTPPLQIRRLHMQMLWPQPVGIGCHRLKTVAQDDLAQGVPRALGIAAIGLWQARGAGRHQPPHLLRQPRTCRDQPDRRVGAMFRLTHQIHRHHQRIGAVVGKDHAVGRPRHHVDPGAPEQQPLGLGHKLIAGPDEDICGLQPEQPVGQRRHTLHPADRQNPVRTAIMQRVKDRVRYPGQRVCVRWRGRSDMRHARHACGGHRHHRAGDMAIAPARHIAARRRHRDQLLPGDQAGAQFHLHVGHAGALRLGKARDIIVRIGDIVLQLLRHPRAGGLYRGVRHHDLAAPAIEFPRQPQGRRLATRFDLAQDARDGCRHILGRDRIGRRRLLQEDLRHGARCSGNRVARWRSVTCQPSPSEAPRQFTRRYVQSQSRWQPRITVACDENTPRGQNRAGEGCAGRA
ncbi:hypothetical protein GALL_430090 [mine drainage metagenome]|uniref:Uncharacterized protein n=1 Tax=mine drainage metagenome TaxID=410659 RepID=A0A1J5PW62_9ZZZZ